MTRTKGEQANAPRGPLVGRRTISGYNTDKARTVDGATGGRCGCYERAHYPGITGKCPCSCHAFKPAPLPDLAPRVECFTCGLHPILSRIVMLDCQAAGHDVRPVAESRKPERGSE